MPAPPRAIVALRPLLAPFAPAFTAPTFRHALVLVAGTLLASGRRPATGDRRPATGRRVGRGDGAAGAPGS
jgi:hypothetical protein